METRLESASAHVAQSDWALQSWIAAGSRIANSSAIGGAQRSAVDTQAQAQAQVQVQAQVADSLLEPCPRLPWLSREKRQRYEMSVQERG